MELPCLSSLKLVTDITIPLIDCFLCRILMTLCRFILIFDEIADAALVTLNFTLELRDLPLIRKPVWLIWLPARVGWREHICLC